MKHWLALLKQALSFMRVSGKWWIAPILFFLIIIGALLVAAQGSVFAPLIYTLF